MDVTLSDLPDILLTHQAISGAYAGSFYHRFSHTPVATGFEDSGYTEDTIFGLLGLIATDGTIAIDGTVRDFSREIQDAKEALAADLPPFFGPVSMRGFHIPVLHRTLASAA